jgi:hypothetical protein
VIAEHLINKLWIERRKESTDRNPDNEIRFVIEWR